ncbi:MAG: family N-acetyltransferase [Glaciihabitans sp.]|nr:family N-acetyltransferase [Glaciihabitans sp.]
MKPVVLETARLRLDTPVAADRTRVVEYCQDPVFERFLTLPWPYTEKDARYFLERLVPKGWEHNSEYTWAIRLKPDPAYGTDETTDTRQPAGTLQPSDIPLPGGFLGVISYRTGDGNIGFWLGNPHRGHGYMTEAAAAIIAWVFGTGATRVAWECAIGNIASAAVARKSGFRYLGERPSAQPYRDGKSVPSWYGVLYRDDIHTIHTGWPAGLDDADRAGANSPDPDDAGSPGDGDHPETDQHPNSGERE